MTIEESEAIAVLNKAREIMATKRPMRGDRWRVLDLVRRICRAGYPNGFGPATTTLVRIVRGRGFASTEAFAAECTHHEEIDIIDQALQALQARAAASPTR